MITLKGQSTKDPVPTRTQMERPVHASVCLGAVLALTTRGLPMAGIGTAVRKSYLTHPNVVISRKHRRKCWPKAPRRVRDPDY